MAEKWNWEDNESDYSKRMPWWGYVMVLLIAILLMVLASKADSVPFAVQGAQQVSLATAPALAPTFPTQSHTGNYLQFGTLLPPTVGQVTFTMTLGNVAEAATFWVNLPNGGTVIQGFGVPSTIYHGEGGTLTVSYPGDPATTYGFTFTDPVPEPGTFVLFGTGVLGILGRRKLIYGGVLSTLYRR